MQWNHDRMCRELTIFLGRIPLRTRTTVVALWVVTQFMDMLFTRLSKPHLVRHLFILALVWLLANLSTYARTEHGNCYEEKSTFILSAGRCDFFVINTLVHLCHCLLDSSIVWGKQTLWLISCTRWSDKHQEGGRLQCYESTANAQLFAQHFSSRL